MGSKLEVQIFFFLLKTQKEKLLFLCQLGKISKLNVQFEPLHPSYPAPLVQKSNRNSKSFKVRRSIM